MVPPLYEFAPESRTVPDPDKVNCPVPEMMPEAVKVFPAVPTVQVGLPLSAMGLPMVKLTLVRLIGPTVNVPAPVIPISAVAPEMEIPPHDAAVPNVNPGPSELEFQMAVSDEVGAPFPPEPPDHTPATVPVRSVPVACLVALPANVEGAAKRKRQKAAAEQNLEKLILVLSESMIEPIPTSNDRTTDGGEQFMNKGTRKTAPGVRPATFVYYAPNVAPEHFLVNLIPLPRNVSGA